MVFDLKAVIVNGFKSYIESILVDQNQPDSYSRALFTIFRELEGLRIRIIVEGEFIEIIQSAIEKMIRSNFNTEEAQMKSYLQFLNLKIDPILSAIFGQGHESATSWKPRIEFQIYRSVGLLLMEHIFEIIRDFPESEDNLADLKVDYVN